MITGNPKPDVPRDPQSRPASKFQLSKVGCPIRKSADQRLFAPSHSLSQRTTSFIASYRQGIHQMPLSHLIALISNAHLEPRPTHRLENTAVRQGSLGMMVIAKKTRSHRDQPGLKLRSGCFKLLRATMDTSSMISGSSPLYDVKITATP